MIIDCCVVSNIPGGVMRGRYEGLLAAFAQTNEAEEADEPERRE